MDTTNPTHSTLDFERLKRQGFPEVVYCEGKTPQQVSENLRALAETNGRAFGTRLKAENADVVLGLLPETV